VDLGFEHLFTGHAGLLGMRRGERAAAQSQEEARFLEAMAWPENLQRYQEKTRENIRKLLDWVRKIEKAVPVERVRLWSEGEENFEARVEEILVAH
jgi:phosphoenolpyruvate carboxylase